MADIPPTEPDLAALEARIAQDFTDLCLPAANWVPARTHGGEAVTDVVIIGGGMCGLVAWTALNSGGLRNMRILDRAPQGREGPWLTYARMETLRSPKGLVGPALGHGGLTFRAWYRARFSEAAWEALDKIPRPMWMDYLIWYRKVMGVPVENGVSVDLIEPEGPYLRLHLTGAEAPSILTRKLVMATGRDGTGEPNIPAFMDGVPRRFWAHSADEIDFAALRNKRVALVGVGASAIDNAAEALEAGALEVRHLIRRAEMPVINKMMGIGSFGLTQGFRELPDEWRWRFMRYSFVTQTPPPRGSTLRVSRHKNAYFHFNQAVESVTQRSLSLSIGMKGGAVLETDYLILGTGFTTDPMSRREFGSAAGEIRLWRDAYRPPQGEENDDLAAFPYLGNDFSFQGKEARASWLNRVYCFNYGAAASLGKVSGDIPGISEGAAHLTQSIAATLYHEDIAAHWQGFQDYVTPELLGDEWRATPLPDEA
ncbi:MAG: NAD(P)-binding domain-containing protein [Pseudorhodobacter sp.]